MRCLLLAFVLLAGCSETHTLVVDLRTDYAPGIEVTEARTEIVSGERVAQVPLAIGDDVLGGARVAMIEDRAAGPVRVRVTLLSGAREVAGREILVDLDTDRVVTAVITRSCAGVDCPEACLNATCVDVGCTPETPERCPATSVCDDPSFCDAPAVACLEASCVEGACLERPVDAACAPTEWCDPVSGCAPLPMTLVDAGPGEVDAGSTTCAPSTGDCNGDPADGCETDLSRSRVHCGRCDMACAADERCTAGACETAVVFDSARTLGSAGANLRGFALDVQASGRVALAGKINGTVMVEPGVVLDSGGRDAAYVAFFDATGRLSGRLMFPSSSIASANGVDLNDAGRVWMVGEVRGGLTVPGGAGFMSVGIDPYWVSYDGSLAHQLSGIDGRAGGELGHDIAGLPDGGAIVVGFVNGAEVGGRGFSGPLPGAGNDAFVARVDATGDVTWVRYFGGAGNDQARGVDVSRGTVYVAGFFEDQVTFGGPMRTSAGGADVFVVALDLDGNYVIDVTGGGPNEDHGLGIAAHSSGDAIIVGETSGGAFGGTGTPTMGAMGDAFVARVGTDASVRWVQSAGDPDEDVAHGVAVRGDAVYVAGYFSGELPVGGLTLGDPASARSGYLARVDAVSGDFVWGLVFTGGNTVALGVGVDGTDGVVVGGHFSGTVDFGDGPVAAQGANDVFVVRAREL